MPALTKIRSRPEDAPDPVLDWLDAGTVEQVRLALRNRERYRDEGGLEEMVQTHISTVFLTPRFVFKFKRPLDFGFADFRTLSSRRKYCRAELLLNGRLAPDVYLDVLPLRWSEGAFHLEGAGRIVDYCVVMRRLPAEAMLDRRVLRGSLDSGEIEALAELLVKFHGTPPAKRGAGRNGGLPVLQGNWEENFSQTRPFVGITLPEEDGRAIRSAVGNFLTRNRALLRKRVREGFIRDGHGDLRCEHVYLGEEGIRIIDCIEFNDRFRFGDVANDLAFLLMDLAALGHPEWSRALLERYRNLSGDGDLERLIPFYACYRAFVRGKVTSFKLNDLDPSLARYEELRRKAASFFRLALEFSRQMEPPVLLLVSGLMGSGKSTLASALSTRTGMAVHRSDAIRKELAGSAREGSEKHSFAEGLYTPAWNAATYRELFARGAVELMAGRSVILDASFSTQAHRREAFALAAGHGARAVVVECRLDEASTMERLKKRRLRGHGPSDGREELYLRQKAAFEPIAGLSPEEHIVLDAGALPEALALRVLPLLRLPPPLFSAGPRPAGSGED